MIDSGCGISIEDQKVLCKKFVQVGSDSKKRLGTGLGLWIVKEICMKMNGDLSFHSDLNTGSVFTALIEC